MRRNEILQLLSVAPFQSFTIHMSDGRAFRVEHPDQILVLPLKVILGVGRTAPHSANSVEHLSLLHVTSLEETPKKTV